MGIAISSHTSREKTTVKFFVTLLSCLILVIGIALACLFNSEKIGDWYFNSQKDLEKSVYWYEVHYNITKQEDDLIKLCNNLYLSKNYSKQKKYYPTIISSNTEKSSNKNRLNYMEQYIEAFYYTNDFERYKSTYEEYKVQLKNTIQIALPLEPLINDKTATQKNLTWALGFSDELLKENNNLVVQAALYGQQSELLIRLGDDGKAAMQKQKSEEIKKQLLE